MSPVFAASAARRASLSLLLPTCPCQAASRTPSPLPQGFSPSPWSHIGSTESATATTRQRRISAPDTTGAHDVRAGPARGRSRRSSLSGMPGQPVDSSPLHLHGRKEVAGGSKEQLKDRLRAKLVGEASQSAAVTKEEELQWWDEFTPEEQAEMRLLAMKALQEWVETNDGQGEEWAESLAARGSRESGKADIAAIGEDGDSACNPLQRAQVLALCRAFNESELRRDGTQDVAEALSNSALLPQPKVTSGLLNSLKIEVQKASAEALAREAHLEVKEQKEQRVGRGHWFTRKFGTFDARIKGLILLNLLTFLYGSNVSVLKNSVSLLDPATFAAGRFGIGSLAFSPWLLKAFKDPRIRKAGGELGLWASTGYLTQAVALQTSDAGRVSFISTFTVIVVPLLAGLFGKKIAGLTWVSAAAALAGVGLLESSGAPPAIGDAWALLSALLFGVQMLRTEFHSRSLRREDSMALISLQLTVTAAASALWALVGHIHSGDFTVMKALLSGDANTLAQGFVGVPWWPMLYTGVFSTALCLWIEVVSLHDVSATEAALVYTIEPLWGAGFAWLLLGERWGPLGWVGAALILGGSMTTQLFGKEESSEPAVAGEATKLAGNAADIPAGTRGDDFDLDSFTRALSLYALTEMADKADRAEAARCKDDEEKVVIGSRISREGMARRAGHKSVDTSN